MSGIKMFEIQIKYKFKIQIRCNKLILLTVTLATIENASSMNSCSSLLSLLDSQGIM